MKKLLVLLAIVAMVGGGGACPAFADNVFDDAGDILKGRNEDFLVDLYVAKTISLEKVPYNAGADLRIKLSTPYGDTFFERGALSIGLEF